MKLSRSSEVNTSKELYELFARAGWQAMDINELARVRSEDEADRIKNVLEIAMGAGLEIGQCHAPMAETYAGKSDDDIEAKIKFVEAGVKIADKLKIPYTIVHPFIYSWSEADPDKDKTTEMNMRYLKRITAYASNTQVCLENMPGVRGFITNGEEMKQFTDEIGGLCVCLDTGHLFSVNGKTSDFFKAVGTKVKALHVHDTVLGLDKHMMPMTGCGDWNDFKTTLKEYGYAGNMNSESSFPAHVPNDLRLDAETLECNILKKFL